MKAYLREMLHLLGDERRKLPGMMLLFVMSSILDFVGIGLVGPYVALVVNPHAMQGTAGDLLALLGVPRDQSRALVVLGLLLLGIFAVKAAAAIAIQWRIIRFGQTQQVRLRTRLMHAYQHLPYGEFLRRNSAEFVYAIDSLATEYGQVVQVALRIVSDAIVTIAVIVLLAWQNPMALALLIALLATSVYGYDRMFRRNLRANGEKANQAATMIVQGIHEGIGGLKEIRVLGCEEYFLRKVEHGSREFARYGGRSQLVGAAPRHLIEVVMVAFVVGLVSLFSFLGDGAAGLVPTLGIFGVAALRLTPAANTFASSLIQLRYSRAGVSQLYRDATTLDRLGAEPSRGVADRHEAFQSLVLEDVSFTYPEAAVAALKGLSLRIRANESVGIVGLSGSGKTTLVDVLLGLLEPQQGRMLYNDRPLAESLTQWRAQVAYLPQLVFLIDDTLRRNVALGVDDDRIDDVRLHEALRQASLADLVAQLPEGVDTRLGEHGVRLSGGQRQRVALARAFYYGRDVLVMDEATSALDDETEQEIVDEIGRLKGRKTLLVIAHRVSTIARCDRLIRLEGGRIVEQGANSAMFPRP